MQKKKMYSISVLLLMIYCYLGMFIPLSSITNPLIFLTVFLVSAYWGKGKIIFVDSANKKTNLCWMLIVLFVLLHNNNLAYSFLDGGLIQLFVMIAFLLFINDSVEWHDTWFSCTKILVLIHAIATIMFYYNANLYSAYVRRMYSGDAIVELMNYYKSGEMSGLVSHFSSNGMILSLGIICYFESIMNKRQMRNAKETKKRYFLDIACILAVAYALILSSKRGPLLATILSIAITFIIYQRKNVFKRTVLLCLFAGGFYILYVYLMPFIPGLSTIFDKGKALSSSDAGILNGRISLWNIAIEMFKSSPIFGCGFGSYRSIAKAQNAITTSAHNYYLHLLSELGIVGIILYLTAFISSLIFTVNTLYRINKKDDRVTLECIKMLRVSLEVQLFMIIYSVTSSSLIYYAILIPYFLACAVPKTIRLRIRKGGL